MFVENRASVVAMRCVAICQTELLIRMVDESLGHRFDLEFLVESRTLARRLHEHGLNVSAGELKRTDTYLKADITPGTCVIVEDGGTRGIRKILECLRDAGAALVYVVGVGAADAHRHEEEFRAFFPEVNYLPMAELFGQPQIGRAHV